MTAQRNCDTMWVVNRRTSHDATTKTTECGEAILRGSLCSRPRSVYYSWRVNMPLVDPAWSMAMDSKKCTKCGEIKSVQEFRLILKRGKMVRRSDCVVCGRKSGRAYYRAHREERRIYGRRHAKERYRDDPSFRLLIKERNYLRLYGMTIQAVATLLASQSGICAICGTSNAGGKWGTWIIDHDHETGAVRGLLCHQCNVGLGMLGDSRSTLVAAIEYLDSPPADGVLQKQIGEKNERT